MLSVIAFIVGAVGTPLWIAWLWFMLARPVAWKDFVDRENAFWVRTGIFTEQYTSLLKPLEKGTTAKVVAILGIIVGTGLIIAPFIVRH